MDIRELEKAVRTAIRTSPTTPALATLAGNGQSGALLPAELDTAVQSLLQRLHMTARGDGMETKEAGSLPWV
ncbi:MAG: hypothetical protein HYU30_03550 [Chloroflexi bacterium]|nr:hypothetical protein [Chloroflexota bacterium]